MNTPIANTLPAFDTINPAASITALSESITAAKQDITALLQQADFTWGNLMQPLAIIDETISRLWGPVSHLNSVCSSESIRPVYQEGVSLMTEWGTWIAQQEALYQAVFALSESTEFAALSQAQQTAITHTLRDFRLAGSELKGEAKERFAAIKMEMSKLTTTFGDHVLDATQAFTMLLTDQDDLAGLPESAVAGAAQRAEKADKKGWLFTLDIPSYMPFMMYAKSSPLRQKMYTAFATRASTGDWDNTPVIEKILTLRQECAALLGFEHYAAYSLADKMANSVDEVTSFLRDLAHKSKTMAKHDLAEIYAYAKDKLGMDKVEAWDIAYVSESLRQDLYDLSQEALKPWFPEHHVKQGLFHLAEQLYHIRIKRGEAPVWADAVEYYDVFDAQGHKKAGFYLDPYAREGKRGGAWMDECLVGWRFPDGSLQHPVAYLVCNFDAPVGDKPALWTHDEVITLFHEFGHGLHHMMTNIEVRSVSGINGVPWDAVELPSQFMENFCWERAVLDLFAKHYETGEPLPQAMFEKMTAAKNFHSGMQMLRQVEFSLIDLLLHSAFKAERGQSVQDVIDDVRKEVAVLTPPAFNKFQNSFTHVFAGGYAAGYFSYKWAEVLSSDAYAAFEEAANTEQSIINHDVAKRFLDEVLSRGGSRDMMQSYQAFRGQAPTVDALLRHSGITAA
ncbi:MAG: oligopeptidase A [Zetaproteobacteria bacterium CG2_30_46_52]|nr:MAG: oligopeptidase A [Zetaproteobacteria bacterium CG2_30_46_52]